MSKTPNLGLSVYAPEEYSKLFKELVDSGFGNSPSSNMSIIDRELSHKVDCGFCKGFKLANTPKDLRVNNIYSNENIMYATEQSPTNRLFYSIDGGDTWKKSTLPIKSDWGSLYDMGNGRWVMLNNEKDVAPLYTDNGIYWKQALVYDENGESLTTGFDLRTPIVSSDHMVCINSESGAFLYQTTWTVSKQFVTNDYGATWHRINLSVLSRPIVYKKKFKGILFAFDQDPSSNYRYSEDDGMTWKTGYLSGTSTWSVAMNDTAMLLMSKKSTYSRCCYSESGKSWSSYTVPDGPIWGTPVPTDSGWVCCPSGNGTLKNTDTCYGIYSRDGRTWTKTKMPKMYMYNSGDHDVIDYQLVTNYQSPIWTGKSLIAFPAVSSNTTVQNVASSFYAYSEDGGVTWSQIWLGGRKVRFDNSRAVIYDNIIFMFDYWYGYGGGSGSGYSSADGYYRSSDYGKTSEFISFSSAVTSDMGPVDTSGGLGEDSFYFTSKKILIINFKPHFSSGSGLFWSDDLGKTLHYGRRTTPLPDATPEKPYITDMNIKIEDADTDTIFYCCGGADSFSGAVEAITSSDGGRSWELTDVLSSASVSNACFHGNKLFVIKSDRRSKDKKTLLCSNKNLISSLSIPRISRDNCESTYVTGSYTGRGINGTKISLESNSQLVIIFSDSVMSFKTSNSSYTVSYEASTIPTILTETYDPIDRGFTVSALDGTNTSGKTYNYIAYF